MQVRTQRIALLYDPGNKNKRGSGRDSVAPERHLERESALLTCVHCMEQAICQVGQAASAALQERLRL